jgi:Protein of unknown function (DUF2442)
MSTSARNVRLGPKLSARAVDVRTSDTDLAVRLEDGRTVAVPLAWFPRLERATPEQRKKWRLIGRGVGIHWPDIDEDISVENLLGADGELLMYGNSPAKTFVSTDQGWVEMPDAGVDPGPVTPDMPRLELQGKAEAESST